MDAATHPGMAVAAHGLWHRVIARVREASWAPDATDRVIGIASRGFILPHAVADRPGPGFWPDPHPAKGPGAQMEVRDAADAVLRTEAGKPMEVTGEGVHSGGLQKSIDLLSVSGEVEAILVVLSLFSDTRVPFRQAELRPVISAQHKPIVFYSYTLPSAFARSEFASERASACSMRTSVWSGCPGCARSQRSRSAGSTSIGPEPERSFDAPPKRSETTRRIRGALGRRDLRVRCPGDEFVVVLEAREGDSGPDRVAQKILDDVMRPFPIDGHEVLVSASLGYAVYPEDGDDPETLLKNADAAMYHAKELGRNSYRAFSRSLAQRRDQRLGLEAAPVSYTHLTLPTSDLV